MHAILLQSASVSKLCMVTSPHLKPLVKEEYFRCQCVVSYVYSCLPQVNQMEHHRAHYRDKYVPFPKLDDRISHGVYCNFSEFTHLQAVWGKMLTKHCVGAVRCFMGW